MRTEGTSQDKGVKAKTRDTGFIESLGPLSECSRGCLVTGLLAHWLYEADDLCIIGERGTTAACWSQS